MKNFLTMGLIFSIFAILFTSVTANGQFAKENYDFEEVGKLGLADVQFVGAGDLQLSILEGNDIAATTGLGALFWRIWPNNNFDLEDTTKAMAGAELQLVTKITVASTVDTLSALYNNNSLTNQRDFGSFILAPIGAGPSTEINSLWYFKPYYYNNETGVAKRRFLGIPKIDGIEANFIAASQAWQYDLDQVTHVAVIAWRLGIFHEFMREDDRRTKGYSIRFGLNYSGRSIQGDLGREVEIREKLLSNYRTTFHGAEFALAVRFKNIKAEASLPILHIGADQSAVPGLSGTQFTTTISFIGGFSLELDE